MSCKAIINGVELTEEQLQDGLRQIEAEKKFKLKIGMFIRSVYSRQLGVVIGPTSGDERRWQVLWFSTPSIAIAPYISTWSDGHNDYDVITPTAWADQ